MANGGCQVGQIKAEGTGRGRGVRPETREEFSSFFILGFLDLSFWRMKMTDFGEGPLSKVGEDKVLFPKLLLKIFLDRFKIEFEIQT
jgi:hypothetical protein